MKTPGFQRINLIAHVTTSMGWLGAVVSFVALSIVGLLSHQPQVVRSCYVAMNIVGAAVIVPLSLTALLTGIVQSTVTHWGLFRYYWVVTKLVLTVLATALLLLHQFTAVSEAARQAQLAAEGMQSVGALARQLVFDSSAAVVVLLVITVIAVLKPWGRIPESTNGRYGSSARISGGRITAIGIALFLLVFLLIHLLGGGLAHRHH